MTHKNLAFALTALLGFTVAASGAETLESVEKKIAEQLAKHKTLCFKSKSTSDIQTAGMKMKMTAASTNEFARRPENKWVSRTESKTSTARAIGDEKEEKEDATTLAIFDGQFMYVLTEMPKQKTAMKMKPDPKSSINPLDGKAMFEQLHKDYDLKLLPDETVDGKDTYAIEAVAKKREEAGEVFAKVVNCYDKKTGVAVKSVVYDKAGKVMTTSTTTDIKTDADIPADRFVFKAPPGVEVMDMTKLDVTQTEAAAQEGKQAKESSSEAKPQESKQEPVKEQAPKEEKPKESKKPPIKGLLDKLRK